MSIKRVVYRYLLLMYVTVRFESSLDKELDCGIITPLFITITISVTLLNEPKGLVLPLIVA